MKFAAIALSVGVAATFLVSNLQGAVIIPGEGLSATVLSDPQITHSIGPRTQLQSPQAMRLIDLRSGSTCKMPKPGSVETTFRLAPLGADCVSSPALAKVAYWRSTPHGALIMADKGGDTVLEFAPGDGVLYESVFPRNAMITIVAAKG